MKKIIYFLSSLVFCLIFFITPVSAQAEETIYFFYGDGCPHCAKEEAYLEQLTHDRPEIKVLAFEVWKNRINQSLMRAVGEALAADVSGVPLTVVGDNYLIGFLNAQTTGRQIEAYLDQCADLGCEDVAGRIIEEKFTPQDNNSNQNVNSNTQEEQAKKSLLPETIGLPIFGEIEVKKFSLPILTVIIAALDGFNPCAMWTLLFLISILLGMKDKKRRWILGIAFILASGFVYFLFMVAWLNLFLFLGFVVWIRILIGAGAVVFGIFSAHKYFKDREGGCETAEDEKRQKIFEKIKSITRKDQFIFALFGIILLAAAVNLVELVCSAGFPAIYTGILSLHNLPRISYYLYLLLYIFFFILDDIIVFVIAMVTLEAVGIQSKYARISSLVGGIILTIIGILLILKPGVLMLNL